MTQDKVQMIVDRVFPQIVNDRGPGRQGIPRVELHSDIYARYSGIEGMEGETLHPLQEGFMEEHGLQCGFCTPGMIMSSKHLLDNNPEPTEEEIRRGISGNLCRCTGYQNIVKAVQYASNKIQESTTEGGE